MSKIKQIKIPVTLGLDGELKLELNLDTEEPKYRLVRERDNLLKESARIMWIEFNDEGRFKSKHDEPAVGRSLMMSPFNRSFTWQTTTLTEIVEEREGYCKFKTQNSNYELWKELFNN